MLSVPLGDRVRWSILGLGILSIGLFTGCFRTFSVKTALVAERPETPITYENLAISKSERYRLQFTANRECYLYVVREAPDGQVTLLLPGQARRAGENRLYPGETRTIPDGEAWIESSGQEGTDLLTFLVSDKASSEFDALRYRQDLKHEDIVSVVDRLRAQHASLQKPPQDKIASEGIFHFKRYSKIENLFQYEIKIVRN
jgi:hypothetical protein